MPQADFTVRQGDDFTIADTLKDANGDPVDIAGATVTLTWTPIQGATAEINAAVASNNQAGDGADGSKGTVSYTGDPADSAVEGYKLAAWTVTYTDSTVQTFPNDGYILVHVTPEAPTAAGTDYLTLEQLKSAREMTGYSYADAEMAVAITAASRAIDNLCHRRFYQDADATSVRYYTPRHTTRLFIDDLVTLTTLQTDQNSDSTFEATWTENTDFFLEPLNAATDGRPYTMVKTAPFSSYRFYCWPRSVKVTGRFGWSAIPDPIVQATSLLASRLLARSREATFGVITAGGIDSGVAIRIAREDPDVAILISDYIRRTPIL